MTNQTPVGLVTLALTCDEHHDVGFRHIHRKAPTNREGNEYPPALYLRDHWANK